MNEEIEAELVPRPDGLSLRKSAYSPVDVTAKASSVLAHNLLLTRLNNRPDCAFWQGAIRGVLRAADDIRSHDETEGIQLPRKAPSVDRIADTIFASYRHPDKA